MITIMLVGYLLLGLLLRWQFKRAHKLYKVTKNGDVWVVRDAKGRFVTCSNNWWDVCKVGV